MTNLFKNQGGYRLICLQVLSVLLMAESAQAVRPASARPSSQPGVGRPQINQMQTTLMLAQAERLWLMITDKNGALHEGRIQSLNGSSVKLKTLSAVKSIDASSIESILRKETDDERKSRLMGIFQRLTDPQQQLVRIAKDAMSGKRRVTLKFKRLLDHGSEEETSQTGTIKAIGSAASTVLQNEPREDLIFVFQAENSRWPGMPHKAIEYIRFDFNELVAIEPAQ